MDEVRIATASGEMPGVLAVPDGEGPWPGMIVIHEAFGLNDDIRAQAQRFADMGYVALAPDLLYRSRVKAVCIMRTMRALGEGGGEPLDDLEAARAWLAERAEVDGSRIGVTGFCMGGGFALLLAVRAPLGAAAVFYGAVPQTPDALEGVCPVFGAYGANDRPFRKHGRRLREFLGEAGVPHVVKFYRDAGHSFMNRHSGASGVMSKAMSWGPMKIGYNERASENAWATMEAFFAEHLDGHGGLQGGAAANGVAGPS